MYGKRPVLMISWVLMTCKYLTLVNDALFTNGASFVVSIIPSAFAENIVVILICEYIIWWCVLCGAHESRTCTPLSPTADRYLCCLSAREVSCSGSSLARLIAEYDFNDFAVVLAYLQSKSSVSDTAI